VINDCTDNERIDGSYSSAEYQAALKDLPTDIAEYTSCRSLITAAQRRGAKRQNSSTDGSSSSGGISSGGGTSGGGTTDSGLADVYQGSKGEAAVAAATAAAKPKPTKLGAGSAVTPGAAGFTAEALRNSIPTPLAIVIALLAAAGIAAVVLALRDGVPALEGGVRSLKHRVSRRNA
jgi:hypothetical protein